jgi:hypothetical protein
MTYTDLWEIITNAQKGSGYTRSKTTTRAKTVLDSLARKGWHKTYIKTALHNLDDNLLYGWPEELFQESYMKETVKLHKTLELSLINIGVKPSKARETAVIMSYLENTCYTSKQLLDNAIEYILGKFDPITHPDVKHFFQPDVLDIWIPYKRKELINVPYSCQHSVINRFEQTIRATFPTSDAGKILFHTTNWRSVTYLINNIILSRGRACLDFGYNPSFYVSESPLDALEWGIKNSHKWSYEVAIFVFYVPNNFQTEFEFKDLRNNADEWKWAVSTFRDCEYLPDAVDYEETYDFIYGPMMSNPSDYVSQGPKMHKLPIMQMAAKTNMASRYLYRCMKGAMIFKKNDKP